MNTTVRAVGAANGLAEDAGQGPVGALEGIQGVHGQQAVVGLVVHLVAAPSRFGMLHLAAQRAGRHDPALQLPQVRR